MRKKLAPLNREYCELGVGDRVVGLPSPPPAPNLQANTVALPFFAPVPAHSLPFANVPHTLFPRVTKTPPGVPALPLRHRNRPTGPPQPRRCATEERQRNLRRPPIQPLRALGREGIAAQHWPPVFPLSMPFPAHEVSRIVSSSSARCGSARGALELLAEAARMMDARRPFASSQPKARGPSNNGYRDPAAAPFVNSRIDAGRYRCVSETHPQEQKTRAPPCRYRPVQEAPLGFHEGGFAAPPPPSVLGPGPRRRPWAHPDLGLGAWSPLPESIQSAVLFQPFELASLSRRTDRPPPSITATVRWSPSGDILLP
ncbi:hypothetical protein ACCO45_000152 [Purpureocillium lilacinum]|uniref:Uncharacterized protein n=1 Tax=Purpureocillium lilacinum TaxID=33203 RepID=A0ACC4E486_PURLI